MPLTSVPSRRQTDSAVRWTFSFVRPYRSAVALLAGLSLTEIALRVLAPWPLKAIVDYLTRGAGPPGLAGLSLNRPAAWLAAIFLIGCIRQLAHEFVLLCDTRLHARLGLSMVDDLRARRGTQQR